MAGESLRGSDCRTGLPAGPERRLPFAQRRQLLRRVQRRVQHGRWNRCIWHGDRKVQQPDIKMKLQTIPMSSTAAFFPNYVLKLQWGRRVAERPPILRRRLQPEEYRKRLPHFPAFSKRTEHLGDGLYERGLDSAGGFEEHRH